MSDLIAALAAAQAEFKPIAKSHTADAGKYTYTYANLADTLAAVIPALNKHGIVLLQPMQTTDDDVVLQTVLMGHGETLSSSVPLALDGLPAQEAGKLISYMRRYLVTSFLGLAADDDDAASNTPVRYKADGAPSRRSAQEITANRGGSAPGEPATDSQRKFVRKLQNELGWSPVEASAVYLLLCKKDGPDVMTKAEASQVIDELNAVKKREKHVTFDDDGNPKIGTVAEFAENEEPWT